MELSEGGRGGVGESSKRGEGRERGDVEEGDRGMHGIYLSERVTTAGDRRQRSRSEGYGRRIEVQRGTEERRRES